MTAGVYKLRGSLLCTFDRYAHEQVAMINLSNCVGFSKFMLGVKDESLQVERQTSYGMEGRGETQNRE